MIALLAQLAHASPWADCASEPGALWSYAVAYGAEVLDDGELATSLAVGGSVTFALGPSDWRLGPFGEAAATTTPRVRAVAGLELGREHAPFEFTNADYMSDGGAWVARLGVAASFPEVWEVTGSLGWTTRNDILTWSYPGFPGYCARPRWDARHGRYRGVGKAWFAVGGGARLDVGVGPGTWRVGAALTWSPGFVRDVVDRIDQGLRAEPQPTITGSRADVHTAQGVFDGRVVDATCGDEDPPWLALRIETFGPPTDLRAVRPELEAVAERLGLPWPGLGPGCTSQQALTFLVTDWTVVDPLAAQVIAVLEALAASQEVRIAVGT